MCEKKQPRAATQQYQIMIYKKAWYRELLPLILLTNSAGGILKSPRNGRSHIAYWIHDKRLFIKLFFTKHSKLQYLIPADIVSIDIYKKIFDIYETTPIEKPALIYNFTALRKHKNLTMFLTTEKYELRSWGYGLKAFVWNEREAIEMTGRRILGVKDARNLLLDYGYYERPLLKKNKLTKDNTLYYNTYSRTITFNSQNRPLI